MLKFQNRFQKNNHQLPQNFFNSHEFLQQEKKFLEKNSLIKITENDQVIIDIPYSRNDNFCHIQLYSHPFVYLHKTAYQNLKEIIEEAKKQDLKIKIWDCFRPFAVQAFMTDKFPEFVRDGYVSHPNDGIATHVRGIAIDLTLVKNNLDLPMGTQFDSMELKAHHDSPEISAEENFNRQILIKLMTNHGFEIYENEWWHYNLSSPTQYPKIMENFLDLLSNEVKNFLT